ncbi:MAG: amidohydrolase family protein [Betaproteobacteria bacterium]|nr:amidohydrolase family protein [Betaproteobacteria bacterium]
MDLPCLPPRANAKQPDIPTPRGACDAHFHLFGPAAKFPFAPERAYTPPDAPLEALLAMHARIGVERGVIIQGNPHGTDNSALLDALAREPRRLRAVAIANDAVSGTALKRMADAGVCALRFHHMPKGRGYSALGLTSFAALAPRMADLNLHAQFMMDVNYLQDAVPYFEDWRLPVVVDHMGNIDAASGVKQPGFQLLCKLLAEGRLWVKVSGAYRISKRYPDYPDARAFHEALVRTNPEQLIWGTDWPHPRLAEEMPDDGHLLDLFNTWTPDAALRRKILVENPARLYGFER